MAIKTRKESEGDTIYGLLDYDIEMLFKNEPKNGALELLQISQSCSWCSYIFLVIAIGVICFMFAPHHIGEVKEITTYTLDDEFKGQAVKIEDFKLFTTIIISGTAKEVIAKLEANTPGSTVTTKTDIV